MSLKVQLTDSQHSSLFSANPSLDLSLRWRHNERDGVSDDQPHDCLFNRFIQAQIKETWNPASMVFMWGIHRWPVNSPRTKGQ